MTMYVCCNDQRRAAIRKQKVVNGIDYLEVVNVPSSPQSPRSVLLVHFINPLHGRSLVKSHVQIEGSTRPIKVYAVEAVAGNTSRILRIETDNPENYLTYTLSLKPDPTELPLDTLFSTLEFTYQDSTDIDPLYVQANPVAVQTAPEIDYLARDFNSFRQLMLDRLTTLIPTWTERSEADMGVMLVELLAYVADYLSYRQDVIATESYLTTARRRISVRRHARLLGYYMHDGKNARVWVQIKVNEDMLTSTLPDGSIQPALKKGTTLFTRVFGENHVRVVENSVTYNQIMAAQPLIFETIETAHNLYQQHNEMHFYTWGARDCTLPIGATSATLSGSFPHLQAGDVLIFQEMMSSRTGEIEGAEPTHRCAVRLTKVSVTTDPLGKLLQSSSQPLPQPTTIEEVIVEDDETLVEHRRHEEHGRHEKRRKHGQHKKQESHEREEKHEEKEEHERREEQIEDRKEQKERKEHQEDQIDDDGDEMESTMKLRAIQSHHQEGKQEERRLHARQEPKRGRPKKLSRHASRQKKHEHDMSEKREEKEEREKREDREEREEEREPEEQEIDITERITAPLSLEGTAPGEEITAQERIVVEEHIDKHGHVREEERRVEVDVTIQEEPDYSLTITHIEWAFEDALSFPLCISATTDYEYGHQYLPDVSVALGNIVLADHGQHVVENGFATVPCPILTYAPTSPQEQCDEETSSVPVPPRFYPSLSNAPLTHSVTYDERNPPESATATLAVLSHNATPAITLSSHLSGEKDNADVTIWSPRRDLLNCGPADTCFVTESEADGITYLRFGDGQYGARPEPNSIFIAHYRIGNGVSGNIGADSIAHIMSDDTRISGVNNPLPAQGGREPESIDSVRLDVPGIFQKQERAVTTQDAKMLAALMPNVRRANAQLRWTGSWYTLFIVAELIHNTPAHEQALRQTLERFRMAGSEMVLVQPVYVPLEITMNVTTQAGYKRSDVSESLLELFSNRLWPDGQRGLFAPETITFGQSVYLNTLLGAAHAIPGVETVDIETFQRLGIPGDGLKTGELTMDWLELPRLDNDPVHPENGVFHLNIKGA